MAISKDTNALVAAQLTQAWATIFATKEGAGGLLAAELQGKIAEVYLAFRDSLEEVPVRAPHDTSRLVD